MTARVCSPRYPGGWGGRIAWVQKIEAIVSQDCATELQPGTWWQSKTLSQNKKQKTLEIKCSYFSLPSFLSFFYCILGFGVHVKNMQDCCVSTYMAVWFAAFLPITYIWHYSPWCLSPTPHPPLSLPYFPLTDPSVWCSPPCVHVFSLFNTHLWVRTCSVWFSVLVSVCWE